MTLDLIITLTIGLLAILCFLYATFIERFWVKTKRIKLKTQKINPNCHPIKIIHLTDLHLNKFGKYEEKVLNIVNKSNPDFIILTGDYANSSAYLDDLDIFLSRLKPKVSTIAVKGNWDIWKGLDRIFQKNGAIILKNTSLLFSVNGAEIFMAGLEYKRFNIERAFTGITDNSYNIVLCHMSENIAHLNNADFDVYLCGNTHGGQVRMPFIGPPFLVSKLGYKYHSGLFNYKEKILYINKGIGVKPYPAPQVRFFCRPEITLFEISGI